LSSDAKEPVRNAGRKEKRKFQIVLQHLCRKGRGKLEKDVVVMLVVYAGWKRITHSLLKGR